MFSRITQVPRFKWLVGCRCDGPSGKGVRFKGVNSCGFFQCSTDVNMQSPHKSKAINAAPKYKDIKLASSSNIGLGGILCEVKYHDNAN